MKTSQKGFIGIIAIVIVALAIGAGVMYYAVAPGDDNRDKESVIKSESKTQEQSDTGQYVQPSTVPQSQDTQVKGTETNTSAMGFTIKNPSGWLAMDEMAGYYTISQTEATGWKKGSNLEVSIVKSSSPRDLEPGFVYCGKEIKTVSIDNRRTDFVQTCKGSVMEGYVWHNGYSFIGKSTQESGNHDADMKIFADIVSSFLLKK